jgi:hypothetical protein
MRTEEIFRRDAEYRAARQALGGYDVMLVMAQQCPDNPRELPLPDGSPADRRPGSSKASCRRVLGASGREGLCGR